jgi:SH3-like domain-containing protein
MRYSTRVWLYRAAPVAALGLLGLMLIPAPATRVDGSVSAPAHGAAGPAPAATTAVATLPQFLKASVVVPASAPATTGESAVPAPQENVPTVTTAVASTPATTVPLSANWSDYISGTPAPAAAAPADSTDGHVGAMAVNARSGPSTTNDTRFVLAAGEPVRIGESSGSWVHVYRQDGSDGWVYSRYLAGAAAPAAAAPAQRVANAAPPRTRPAASSRPSAGNAALVGRVAAIRSSVPVRAAPGSAVMFVLAPGERVRVAESRGSWLRVVTEDGYSGWIPG